MKHLLLAFLAVFYWLVNPAPVPSPKLLPTPIPTPTPTIDIKQVNIHYDVPFTVQAPFSGWKNPRLQDACEEASALMAVKWATGKSIGTQNQTLDEILAVSQYQSDNYGQYHDTSAADTVTRIFQGYYHFSGARVQTEIVASDIIRELAAGNLIITPMNGRLMGNPWFTPPGPERHNVLIIGYDGKTNEFITNDPGVTNGKDYRYPADIFYKAIRDYPTGDHLPIPDTPKTMIIIQKS